MAARSRSFPLPSVAEQEKRLDELSAWPWAILTLRERAERERLERTAYWRRAGAKSRLPKRVARMREKLAELEAQLHG